MSLLLLLLDHLTLDSGIMYLLHVVERKLLRIMTYVHVFYVLFVIYKLPPNNEDFAISEF